MFENGHDDLSRTQELGSTGVEPVSSVENVFSQQDPQQAAGGSYYSPRSGDTGGYPPVGGYPNGGSPDGGNEPPKKRSHKGLKALALFAGVAFVAYASIQCYQYATENEKISSFLGRQNSEISEEQSSESSSEQESSKAESSTKKNSSDASSKAEPLSVFDLAAPEDAMSIPEIVKKITPATVGVASTFVMKGQTTYNPFSFWGFEQSQSPDRDVPATGTGIIMRDNQDGSYYIVTNAHVINDTSEYNMGEAKEVQVVLNEDYYDGETTMEAEIVAFEASEDIAVLKVKTDRKLTVAEFGNSDDLQVGEAVVAIGNPLGFELFGSVTTGIVSALDREVTINDQKMRLIQTDTAINAGNSGGPLINCYGQVIGINSSKISSSYYGNEPSVEGLCFAIPMTHAQKVINDLINYGYVTGKPQIGIVPKDVDELTSQRLGLPVGVLVRAVSEGSPAEEAGIKVFDVIIAVDGKTVTNYEELKAEKDQHEAGDTITLTVSRDGIDLEIPLTLAERGPENQ